MDKLGKIINGAFEKWEKSVAESYRDNSESVKFETDPGQWLNGDKMKDYPRIPYKSFKIYCSFCGHEAIIGKNNEYVLTDYCPWCGKKMY